MKIEKTSNISKKTWLDEKKKVVLVHPFFWNFIFFSLIDGEMSRSLEVIDQDLLFEKEINKFFTIRCEKVENVPRVWLGRSLESESRNFDKFLLLLNLM